MAEYPTDVYGPAALAPHVTHRYAVCRVCGVQWQIRSDSDADAQGCSFCNAPARAISIRSESPDSVGEEL